MTRVEPRESAACEPGSCAGKDELRCGCGSLLARLVAGGVELKCRRCKRTWVAALETGGRRAG